MIDTVSAAATVPLGNYSADTLEILRRVKSTFDAQVTQVTDCKALAAAKGPQCTLDIQAPPQVDVFPIEVAFDYIDSAQERDWFKNLPTTLELPRETVDKLRAIGRRLLSEDSEFKRLMEGVHGCLAVDGKAC
jgi:NTE family protein